MFTTKRFFGIIVVLAAIFATAALAQTEPRPLAVALNQVGIFNLPDPTPVCVTPQQTSTSTPTGTPLPSVQQVTLQAFCLQSNGLVTKFRVQVSDPYDAGIEYYIQNSGTPSHVESFTLYYNGGLLRPMERFDRSGSIDVNGAWLYLLGDNPNRQPVDFVFDGVNTFTFTLVNSDIGNEGRPAGIAFYMYDKRDGQTKIVFPETGYVTIPTTLSVNLPPSQTLYRLVGKSSRFQLVASISSLGGPSEVTTMWLADGHDNITDMLNSQSVIGVFPPQPFVAGQPALQRFDRRVDYDLNNLHDGARLRVTVLSPFGVAYDEAVYGVQDIFEPLTPPTVNQ